MNHAGPAVAGALCALVVVVPVMLLIAATILRTAVALVNKVLGGRSPTDLDFYDTAGDYRHARYPRNESHAGFLIPQPSTGRAVAIVLSVGVMNFAVNFGMAMAVGMGAPTGAADLNRQAMLSLISLGVGLGYFVAEIHGRSYIAFIAPGLAVSTALFTAFF